MTIHVLRQYLKHNTCIVLQYMYCVTSPQCVPSLRSTFQKKNIMPFDLKT